MKILYKFVLPCLMFVCAAGVVFVGNRSGWFGHVDSTQKEQTCPHGLTASNCAFCDDSLVETLGFCFGHGVPEAFCTRCNPTLIVAFKSVNDWCAEHNLPESQCTICNPELLEEETHEHTSSSKPEVITLIENKHFLRNQQIPSETCLTESFLIQFLTPKTAEKTGLEYGTIVERQITETILCNAEITYNGNHFAHLSSRASGVISQVYKDLGDSVSKGDLLATVDSSDLGDAKSKYLQAHALVDLWEKNYAREKGLFEINISSEREVFEAKTKLTENKIQLFQGENRLRNLGLNDATIRDLTVQNNLSSLLPLTAPFGGVIVKREAVRGEVVHSAQNLFAITDTSHMWAILDLHEADFPKVKLGQPVILNSDSQPGVNYSAITTWLSSYVDPKTRTAKVRIDLPNPQGVLKSGMFGKAHILVKDQVPSMVVPKSAVQWEGCCNVVFIKKSDSVFEPRKIKIEYEGDSYYAINGNVKLGESVVTTGSFLLKTEILKGSIGAGCCELEPGK